jgi:hypothetical protein
MSNQEITFGIFPETFIVLYEGRQEGARLYAQACGLDIYLISEDNTRHPDCIPSMIMNACIDRHIPLISLHYIVRDKKRTRVLKTETKGMF